MTDLERRLRDLPLRPPADLVGRALHAEAGTPSSRAGWGHWLPVAGTLVAVFIVVLLTVTVFAHPDAKDVFYNISAGLGT